MMTTGSQTFQITSDSNQNPLTRPKEFSENLTLKLLPDVIFPFLSCQSDVPSFKMANFKLDDYLRSPNF